MLRKFLWVNSILMMALVMPILSYAESIGNLLRNPNDPQIGNKKAGITIVEFFDYQCSFCQTMTPVLASMVQGNRNVRVVFKEYPMMGAASKFASRAALAANQQGKYYPFSHALLTRQYDLTQGSVLATAKRIGLDVKQLQKDMYDATVTKQLNNNFNLASAFNIEGTPVFIVARTNANRISQINFLSGYLSVSQLQRAIEQVN